MLSGRTTLTRFLIEERGRHPDASGDLNALILDIALAAKAISGIIAAGSLRDVIGAIGGDNAHGESQQKLDIISNNTFIAATEWGGRLAGIVSEELAEPYPIPRPYVCGKYLLVLDPLDGSSNIDVNVSVGSIFSILRSPDPGASATADDFLQPGNQQVCAGYVIYGPSTMLVLTVGTGVQGFTLDPGLGEFILTHPMITIPAHTHEFAINASNNRFWEPAVKRYVDECLAGTTGPRQKDFNMRWIASLVAEAHRILMRGGVFMYPRDTKIPDRAGRLRLLYEANPISFIVEQAGGMATTGRHRILEAKPVDLHQRIAFIFGSRDEVQIVEQYHQQDYSEDADYPLFAPRGLFRESASSKP